MRTLDLGTSEVVEGLIEDKRRNDLTVIKEIIELAVAPEDVDEHPTTGWAVRDTVEMLNSYTIISGRLHAADERGIFKLWGHWINAPEEVYIMIGKFRVV